MTERHSLNSGREAPSAAETSEGPVGTPFVPTNMRPSLQEASESVPSIYDNDCHRNFGSVNSSGCQYGSNPDAPLVALFGDSHAASWFPALEALAVSGEIRLDVNTKSACTSANITPTREGAPYTECVEWREGVIDRLQHEKPAVVLLGNFSSSYLTDESTDSIEEWTRGLSETVESLSADSEVGILADIPYMGETPAICLSTSTDEALECARSRDVALNAELAAAEEQMAESGPGTFIDFTSRLCNDDTCPAIIGDLLVYRDAHHLTIPFSESLSGPLAAKIRPLLETNTQA